LRAFTLPGLLICFASIGLTCESVRLIWIPESEDADPLFRFTKGDKVGYIDKTGKVVVPPVLPSYAGEFHSGLVEIHVSDGIYADKTGRTVINKGLFRGWDFSEGLAVAMRKDGENWGYIDRTGNFAISPRFKSVYPTDYVWSFAGGYAKIEAGGKIGYIDHSGDFAIQPQFLDGDSFSDGMARVIVEGPCAYFRISEEAPCPDFGVVPVGTKVNDPPPCKYSFIDTAGHVMSQRFDYARRFGEGLAPILKDKRWGFIDKTGTTVIEPRFDMAEPFSEGLARVREHDRFGFIDRTGKYAIVPQFANAGDFHDGRAPVGDRQNGYWYIDKRGERAFQGDFSLASRFFKGLAHVRVGEGEGVYSGMFAYIDTNGGKVFVYDIPARPYR
jgi:hypothetical protein